MSSSFRLKTLGELRLEGPDGDVRELRRRERGLLARIARCAPAPIRRAGPFLEGVEEDADDTFRAWIESERAAVRRLLKSALEMLRVGAHANGAWDDVVPRTRRLALNLDNGTKVFLYQDDHTPEKEREGRIPVLSCEGPCIRGEIARQAAHRVGRHPGFARACQGETLAVPHSGMAHWVRGAERVVVLDGCFLRCQARLMRRMLEPGQLVEIDALPLYRKYTDTFEIDDAPAAEREAVADDVAQRVLEKLTR